MNLNYSPSPFKSTSAKASCSSFQPPCSPLLTTSSWPLSNKSSRPRMSFSRVSMALGYGMWIVLAL